MITLEQNKKGQFRLLVNGIKIWNDQSLTMYKILEMIKNQKVTEDLIIELEDKDIK